MYFPTGLPQEFLFPKESDDPQHPIAICSNRDRSLILLLTDSTLHIWFCKPCVQVTALQRSAHSLKTAGKNVDAVWKSDATTILVTTEKGGLLFFKLETSSNADGHGSLYLKKGYTRKQNMYDAMFLGEGIPALSLQHVQTHNLGNQISSIAMLRDELVICTTKGDITRINWECKVNEVCSTHVNQVLFSHNLQQSKGHQIDSTEIIVDIEYSPLLGGFVAVLSGGRGFFLTAPNARFDKKSLHGVWAPDLRDAVCVHANHKYRLIAYGCLSGKGIVYYIDPATGALMVSHELQVPSKDYPDAGLIGGSICKLAWTPDECAIVGAWSKGGIAVWSVFGALLYCSLQSNYGLPSSVMDQVVVRAMEWGAEGFQLWVSVSRQSDQTANSDSDIAAENGHGRESFDFLQIGFVKSPLTVNPCLANHKHLFLQGEDRVYVNIGSEVNSVEDDSSNILIANKQWRVIPIKYTYLGSNWPIRYSAIDDNGSGIAVAGRTGLAHFSLVRRRWILFGNEAQEKSMVVSGGLLWWNGFICLGCFNLEQQKDEIRFYPTGHKLDNGFCTSEKVPFAVLLINTFKDYLICLCADRHIMIFSMQLKDNQAVPRVDLKRIQEVSVDGFIPHPMCVTFITLSPLKAETIVNRNQESKQEQTKSDIPESIFMNVAGRLLMFQRDWSRPQPKNSSNRYRSVPFCNPMMVASSVENVWIPDLDDDNNKDQLTSALWLSSGASGMKVWLTLSSQENVHTHSFMSKRNMIPFDVDIYPLAVLADDAVILGAASDTSSSSSATPCSPTGQPSISWLNFSTIERTSQIYLHQVLRQLLRQNLGFHALRLARCFTALPYFSHILELLLHKVLEEEATSKEPIPDPLLPRVVAFSKEFAQYRQTIVHCARKTEFALWDHLFSTVGSPKGLFEECLVEGDLHTAASYLIILQNLEKYYISRQLATLLLEAVLENRNWSLARDVVRHLKAIDEEAMLKDPIEADSEPVSRNLPNRYGQRFSTSPIELEQEIEEAFGMTKPPLTRNTSWSLYESESKTKEKSSKIDTNISKRTSISGGSHAKNDVVEPHNIDLLLYKHARKLLTMYRLRDLGLFAANLEGYELVAFLRKEHTRGAKIDDPVQAIKQLHNDFKWPLPVLTHSAFYSSFDSGFKTFLSASLFNESVRELSPEFSV